MRHEGQTSFKMEKMLGFSFPPLPFPPPLAVNIATPFVRGHILVLWRLASSFVRVPLCSSIDDIAWPGGESCWVEEEGDLNKPFFFSLCQYNQYRLSTAFSVTCLAFKPVIGRGWVVCRMCSDVPALWNQEAPPLIWHALAHTHSHKHTYTGHFVLQTFYFQIWHPCLCRQTQSCVPCFHGSTQASLSKMEEASPS